MVLIVDELIVSFMFAMILEETQSSERRTDSIQWSQDRSVSWLIDATVIVKGEILPSDTYVNCQMAALLCWFLRHIHPSFSSWPTLLCLCLGVSSFLPFLSQHVCGFEVYRDVVVFKDPPEAFQYFRQVWDRNAVELVFQVFLHLCWGLYLGSLDEGPVWAWGDPAPYSSLRDQTWSNQAVISPVLSVILTGSSQSATLSSGQLHFYPGCRKEARRLIARVPVRKEGCFNIT